MLAVHHVHMTYKRDLGQEGTANSFLCYLDGKAHRLLADRAVKVVRPSDAGIVTFAVPRREVRRRDALDEVLFLPGDVGRILRCEGHSWNVHHCKSWSISAYAYRYSVGNLADQPSHPCPCVPSRQRGRRPKCNLYYDLRLKSDQSSLTQCQNTMSPGLTFGTDTIVSSSLKWG